jgi:hypothetical protein
MGRGRTRSVTSATPPMIPGAKLPAPPELSAAQAAIWDRIVNSLPAGWITTSNAPLMTELARHISFADQLAGDIEAARAELAAAVAVIADDVKAQKAKAARCRQARALLLSLTRAHLLQSGAVARLSQKLRLTKFSQYTRSAESAAIAARNASTAPEPWNDWRGGNGGREQ